MVPFNVSFRQDLVPPQNFDAPGARSIANGPLYSAHETETVLRMFVPSVIVWTEDCKDDVVNLGWGIEQVQAAISGAISSGRYIGSEWCMQRPNGPCIAADAYELIRTGKPKKLYIKFAIAKTGMAVLVASCHPSMPVKK